MQFGLMVFFAPAFPLAAMFSLVNNLMEIRSDAFKMCLLFQRPFGQRVANIGTWQVSGLMPKYSNLKNSIPRLQIIIII